MDKYFVELYKEFECYMCPTKYNAVERYRLFNQSEETPIMRVAA